MSYTKTQWVNNTTPIDENNLNKIEQGIYDNSLVVDAVTNKLNPTDTETYKTAELTEGQITDVIGVNDIIIKGQTSQDGEPTPSSPVDVNVVSGSNVIKISSKNLLDGVSWTKDYALNENNTAFSANGWEYSDYVDVTNANYYYSSTTGVAPKTILYNNNKQVIKVLDVNSNTIYNISQYNAKYIRVSTATVGKSTTKVYEHQGKELPLDLPVENLFDESLITSTTSSIKYIPIQCQANTDYTLSTNNVASPTNTNLFLSTQDSGVTSANNGAYINSPRTINSGNNTTIYVGYRNDLSNNWIQLEKGSSASPYHPYGTDPIELCKIGNYQDYFYKSGSKWYLHKEIEKKVIDGTESWNYYSTGRYFYNSTILNDLPRSASSKVAISFASNRFVYTGAVGSPSDNQMILVQQPDRNNEVDIRYDSIGDVVADFKNWLSANNISVYHSLVTPTNTEITDTTLISQLEAIYNAPLYEQTNITQTNNDLPMVLDITACKDNINGIKAFIRK